MQKKKMMRGLFVSVAVFMACILLSSLILIDAQKIKISAASNNLAITQPTFIDVRKKVSDGMKSCYSSSEELFEAFKNDK